MMKRQTLLGLGTLLATALVLSSCGGRGTGVGGPTGGGDLFAAGPLKGTVRLDELTRGRAANTYTIRTPIGEAPIDEAGNYTVQGYVNSQTPAFVVDETGELRSFAFIERTGTIVDNALVAKSLAMFAAKGYAFAPELRKVLWENLGDAPEVDGLRANLVALGGHLAGPAPEVRDAATLHIGGMLERLRTSPSRMRIEPADGRSGVQVLQQGLNDIVCVNSFRRRAHAFVERIGVTMEGGATEPRQDAITDFGLNPIANAASLNALLADIGTMLGDGNSGFTGNIQWVPTQSQPLHLDVVPSNAVSTKYRVVVVGPGRPAAPVANFTPAMQARLEKQVADTITLDFIVPAVMAAAGPLMKRIDVGEDAKIIAFMEYATGALKDFITLGLTEPGIQAKLESGDFPGAANDIVTLLMTSESFATLRTELIRTMIMTFTENADEEVVGKFLDGIGKFMLAINLTLQGGDFAMIGVHIAQSKTADEFVIDVTKARVKLSPQASVISPLNQVTLRATVPDATGEEAPLVTYRFKLLNLGAVTLKNPTTGQVGPELGSSTGEMIVLSQNHQVGTFRVQAEAIVDRPRTQDDQSLGTAEVSVKVINDKAVLRPAMSSIRPNAALTLTCTINNPAPNAQYMLKWSGTNAAGTIPAAGELTSRRSIVYTAGDRTGTDDVTVEVFQQTQGGLVPIGQSKAGIRVEEEPTIVPAAYGSRIITPTSVAALVTFAEPSRPGSYRLIGVGGNDPSYFGHTINITGGRRYLDIFGTNYDLGAGTMGWGLSAGSSMNPGAFIPSFDARFGGFSFYVEVTR